METLSVVLGVVATLSVLSIIFRDNPFYKAAEAIIIGISAGILVATFFARAWELGFIPLFEQLSTYYHAHFDASTPLVALPSDILGLTFTTIRSGFITTYLNFLNAEKTWGLILVLSIPVLSLLAMLLRRFPLLTRTIAYLVFGAAVAAIYLLLPMAIPVLLGLLFYSSFVRPIAWMIRLPISFFFGFAGSYGLVLSIDARIWQQIAGSIIPWFTPGVDYPILQGLVTIPFLNLDGIIITLGTVVALSYFFMTREHRGVAGKAATAGSYFIMVALGAKFGSICVYYLSLLYERLLYLFNTSSVPFH